MPVMRVGLVMAYVLHFLPSIRHHLNSDDCLEGRLSVCRCPVVSTVVRVLTSERRLVCSGLGFCVCVLFCLNVFVVYFS